MKRYRISTGAAGTKKDMKFRLNQHIERCRVFIVHLENFGDSDFHFKRLNDFKKERGFFINELNKL